MKNGSNGLASKSWRISAIIARFTLRRAFLVCKLPELFREQLFHARGERFTAEIGLPHHALLVQQPCRWNRIHSKRNGNFVLPASAIELLGPCHPLLLERRFHRRLVLVQRNSNDFKSLVVEFLVSGDDAGHLSHAGAAPTRPKVQQD